MAPGAMGAELIEDLSDLHPVKRMRKTNKTKSKKIDFFFIFILHNLKIILLRIYFLNQLIDYPEKK